VAVPHQTVAAVGKFQALHRGEKRLGLHLDSLPSSCRAPDRRIFVSGSSISSG
jgi:hypothetical protein